MIVKLIIWLLKSKRLSAKNRVVLINALMDKMNAVPLQSLIAKDNAGNLYVAGRKLSGDEAWKLRENASMLLRSNARKLVQDQVRFTAIDKGFLKNDLDDVTLFYKAAIWFSQEENAVYESIAGDLPIDTVDFEN